jgi:hypothetical protein
MKNIHILPTDKARLYIHQGKLYDHKKTMHIADGTQIPQHIYITSNEEVKDCWVLNTHSNEVYFLTGYYGIQPLAKKIILTTDQNLIKDGVQVIDDEFLEWFVDNPSCEEVETKVEFIQTSDNLKDGFYYRIIIPNEEPKQEIVKDLGYWKANAEEDYMKVPISVLRYISELENQMYSKEAVLQLIINCKERFGGSDLDDYVEDSKVIKWFEQFKKK